MVAPQHHYSPEFWPSTTLPIPRLKHALGEVRIEGDGWLTVSPWDGSEWTAASLMRAAEERHDNWPATPHELHLRDMHDVDLASPESIRALTQALGWPYDDADHWRDVIRPDTPARVSEQRYNDLVRRHAEACGLPCPENLQTERPRGGMAHVAEVALRVTRVRTMVDHAQAALERRSTVEAWGQLLEAEDDSDLVPPRPGQKAWVDEDPETRAWWMFTDMLNLGLGAISPRIVAHGVDARPDFTAITSSYTVACVMIFNDLLEGLPYRQCADETCGRLFKVRSAGKHARSSGLRYCTDQHARNQSQRERRRAQRAQRAEAEREVE